MERVVEFRQHAAECRLLATRARSPGQRDMLLQMAESWESLADTRERRRIALLAGVTSPVIRTAIFALDQHAMHLVVVGMQKNRLAPPAQVVD